MTDGRRATYADIVALPPHINGEIVDGELFTQKRPPPLCGKAAFAVLVLLGRSFSEEGCDPGEPGGWTLLHEPELHFDDDVVVPDKVAWKFGRANWDEDAPWIEIVPDWVCEIVFPATEVFDRTKKLPLYERVGVPHVWFIDPKARTLDVYELDAGVLRQRGPVYRDRVVVNAPPFQARGIEMWRVWGA